MSNPIDPAVGAEPGLFFFEGLAVMITVPGIGAAGGGGGPDDSTLDFSEPGSPFMPGTGPVV